MTSCKLYPKFIIIFFEVDIIIAIGPTTFDGTGVFSFSTTTHLIKKELSICQSSKCPDPVSFPVLSQIKPQVPLLVVPFRQFL